MAKVAEVYGLILRWFGLEEFRASDLRPLVEGLDLNLLLHRMSRRGYLERASRGVFRAVHPIVLALERDGCRWRGEIRQREYLPMIELLFGRVVDWLWGDLVSLALFGSIARGEAGPESDIDLLLVAENLPRSYSERLSRFREATRGVERLRVKLWKSRGVYPLIDPILLTPEEAGVIQPFYLDMVRGSVILFDREGFMEGVLERLRARLAEMGARRIELPDGRWYWELGPKGVRGLEDGPPS